ncbi:hypothetical protein C2W62_21180 [Candidatus Entotheonella serta]|nr:hypothetical protein C2W62_21180 [Candidatus Entotheonella serta]
MDAFPDIAAPELPARQSFAPLIQMAFRQRGDYRASIKDQDGLKILETAARRDLKPRLDLNVSAGYAGLNRGSNLVDPLTHYVRGLNVLGMLSLELPLRNAAQRGALIERRAVRRQAEIIHQQISQRIASEVVLALELVKNSYDRLTVSHQAESSYERAVETKKKRFRIGDTSLLDVLSLEDSYAEARLNTIDAIRNYLNALIELRFATGSLVTGSADQASVALTQLYAIPLPR